MWLFATPVLALDAYSPQKGFIEPEVFESPGMATFENPAWIGRAGDVTKLESKQDAFGYSQSLVGSSTTIRGVSVGVGFLGLSTSDIARTQFASNGRGEVVGQFGQSFQVVQTTVGKTWQNWRFGGNIRRYAQQLDTAMASGWSVDAGVVWNPDGYWLEAYTENILQTGYAWTYGRTEFLSPHLVLGGGMDLGPWTLQMGYDVAKYERFKVGWRLHPMLGLTGDLVLDSRFQFKRYGLGVCLNLDPFSVAYGLTQLSIEGLNQPQSQLGVSYRW
ncbi:MAG: hypothetical protein AB7F28_01350 [Candidatus Margulisiibacteriota bacterium]